MESQIVQLFRRLTFRNRLRRKLVFTPKALQLVSKQDALAALERHFIDHLGVFEDRNNVEFFLATDPDSLVTTVMLPEEYRD